MNPFIDYVSYSKQLRKLCRELGFVYKVLTTVKSKHQSYPLYSVSINNNSSHKYICISAGIHGNEVAGPLAILEYLKDISFKGPKPNLLFFPVLNPLGFDRNKRINHKNYDLNRHFLDSRPPQEVKAVIKNLHRKNVVFFLSLHEDVDAREFYLIYHYRKLPIYNSIVKVASKYLPIMSHKTWDGDKLEKGTMLDKAKKGYFEYFLHNKGTKYNVCTETPMKVPLNKRVSCNVALIEYVVKNYKKFC